MTIIDQIESLLADVPEMISILRSSMRQADEILSQIDPKDVKQWGTALQAVPEPKAKAVGMILVGLSILMEK